jgi:hypothetical protein
MTNRISKDIKRQEESIAFFRERHLRIFGLTENIRKRRMTFSLM